MSDFSDTSGDYVQLMIDTQGRLYGFILSLLCDPDQAREVLQETNLVLWRKADHFQMGTNFAAWAMRIARFQVMAHRQRQGRDRHVFGDEAVSRIADVFEQRSDEFDDRLAALADCLKLLPEEGRRLIRRRYRDGLPVKRIAEELGHTAGRVAVRLHRLRTVLMQCIQDRQVEGRPA